MFRILYLFHFIIALLFIIPTILMANDPLQQEILKQNTDRNIDIQKRTIKQITPFKGGSSLPSLKKNHDFSRDIITEECFIFNKINFTGNTIFSNKELQKLAKKYLDKCISVNIALEYLMEEIINKYQAKGYILAVSYIPEQNLNTGVLQVVIQEGILEYIEYDDSILSNNAVNFAFINTVNKPLNMRYLEQALENLNKSGAYSVTMDLKPGTIAGYSILILKATKLTKYHAGISFSNDYDAISYAKFPNMHDNKITTYLSMGDVFTNDSLTFNLTNNLHDSRDNLQGSFGISYNIPLGYWDFILNSNVDLSRMVSRQNFGSYNIDTITTTSSFDIKRTLFRGQTYIIKTIFRPNIYSTATYLDNINTNSAYKLYYFDMGFEYQLFNNHFSQTGTINYTRGVPLFGEKLQGRENNQENLIPQNLFDIFKLTINTNIPLAKNWAYNSNISAQYSKDILYTINDFVVISSQGVRGYQGVYANYNSGFTSQNEITYNLFKFNNTWLNNIAIITAIDVGASVDGYNFTITHNKVLAGWYAGIKTQGKIAATLGYAEPINHIYINKNHKVVTFTLSFNL